MFFNFLNILIIEILKFSTGKSWQQYEAGIVLNKALHYISPNQLVSNLIFYLPLGLLFYSISLTIVLGILPGPPYCLLAQAISMYCFIVHLTNMKRTDFFIVECFTGHKSDFGKAPSSIVTTYDVPYDLNSVMHYPNNAFSRNGKPTLMSKVSLL